MITLNLNYQFPVSLSTDAYPDKIISGAMIGTNANIVNRQIRQRYGYNPMRGVGFKEEYVTIAKLYDALLSGRVMCHLFNHTHCRVDGSFGADVKRDANFRGSYIIGVDIDHTRYESIQSYIDTLVHKPSLYYSTYSHLQDGKSVRFRMLYVFDEMICDSLYFRYCATCLNKMIESEISESISDDCNLRCSQYFNGTCRNNPDLVDLTSSITGNVYSLSDIGVTTEGYERFLCNYAGYKTVTADKTERIRKILNTQFFDEKFSYEFIQKSHMFGKMLRHGYITPDKVELDVEDFEDDEPVLQLYDTNPSRHVSPINIELILYDFDRLNLEEFKAQREWKRAKAMVKYITRVESEWVNEHYQKVDEDYFSMFFYRTKLKDGDKRRKTIHERMCIRRIINPEITKTELVVGALIDIISFCDNSDRAFNAAYINNNVNNVMDTSIESLNETYKKTVDYLKENTKPKRGIIYKNKKTHSVETTYEILDQYYDPEKSVQENLLYINDVIKFQVSKSTLYRYLEKRNPKYTKSVTDKDLIKMIDTKLSVRKNLEIIKDNGIMCGNNRVAELLKQKKMKEEFRKKSRLNRLNKRT